MVSPAGLALSSASPSALTLPQSLANPRAYSLTPTLTKAKSMSDQLFEAIKEEIEPFNAKGVEVM